MRHTECLPSHGFFRTLFRGFLEKRNGGFELTLFKQGDALVIVGSLPECKDRQAAQDYCKASEHYGVTIAPCAGSWQPSWLWPPLNSSRIERPARESALCCGIPPLPKNIRSRLW